MRTTVTIDDELLAEVQEITGITDKSTLIREAFTRVIRQDAARRLILLGGSAPDFVAPPRRRFPPDENDPG